MRHALRQVEAGAAMVVPIPAIVAHRGKEVLRVID
jgi:hypothetical protein